MLSFTGEEHLKAVIASDNITVIMAWRPGCPFCDAYKPTFEAVEAYYQEYNPNGSMYFYELNTRDDKFVPFVGGTLLPFNGVPTTVIYRGKKLYQVQLGNLPEEDLKRLCEITLEEINGTTES